MPKPIPTLALVSCLADETVEKFNPAEQSSSRSGAASEPYDHKRGKTGRNRNRGRSERSLDGRTSVSQGTPTPERIAKGDAPVKTPAGHYRAPPVIERLRDRNILDSIGTVNEAMFQAASRFESLFYASGLTGSVAAQDLSRIVVHGGEAAARYMPKSEREVACRQKWREAVKIMGYFEAYPFRGAARLVIDVVCYGQGVKDAAAVHCPGGGSEAQAARGMDRLREGLFTLAVLWKMC